MKRVAAAFAALLLTSCAGYRIGPVKPAYLSDVHAIAVPTFDNKTLVPRIEVLVTDAVIKRFQQDGTFRMADDASADATLRGEIVRIARSPARSVRGNVLATQEFNLVVRVRYRLVDRGGNPLSESRETSGTTSFFVSRDIATDERQAIPLAAEELAQQLVTQVAEGW